MDYWGYKPYVSVAQRRINARREMDKLASKGRTIQPVHIEGRKIATTFWGKAWCDNLEVYSDFATRLPRGRTYVRNGSVCDLQISAGSVAAFVCGSELYTVAIKIRPLDAAAWSAIKRACAGQIGSLVELLQGKLSKGVMDIVTRPGSGLFPKPAEIDLDCSCPDYADMCKHVAATLYGIGARLDHQPELLFKLRGVDHLELISAAGTPIVIPSDDELGSSTIAESDLSAVFGIEFEADSPISPLVAPTPVPTKTMNRRASPALSKKRATSNDSRTQKKRPAAPKKPVAEKSAKTRARAKQSTAKRESRER